ncbi:hypothetical protein ACHWQZ_G001435 [Mnemiopsis leidyi]
MSECNANLGDDVQILEVRSNQDDSQINSEQTPSHITEKFFSEVPFSSKCSAAWQQFKKGHGPKTGFAQCKHCSKVLKTSGGSTKGLLSHLLSAHQIVIPTTSTQSSKRQRTEPSLDTFFAPSSKLEATEMIVRLVCLDGLPLIAFEKSKDLRRLMNRAWFNVPKSHNTITAKLIEYCDNIKKLMKAEFEELFKSEKRVSITMDEWSSISRKRFMNVNAHGENGKTWNLGLCLINGRATAENCYETFKNFLLTFGISIRCHVVAATTDGPTVMKKMRRYLECEHQECQLHGIQLGIKDVFYVKKSKDKDDTIEDPDSANLIDYLYEADQDSEETESDEEPEADNEISVDLTYHQLTSLIESSPLKLSPSVKAVVGKVRATVRKYRKSPLKDEVLQSYIKADHGKPKALVLDVKTRWSSLCTMLDTFLKVFTQIMKAQIDITTMPNLKDTAINFSDDERQAIGDICDVLDIIKAGVDAIGRAKSDLKIAELVAKFTIVRLSDIQDNPIAKVMLPKFKERYNARRTELSDIAMYFHDPASYEGDTRLLQLTLESLYERLTSTPELSAGTDADSDRTRNLALTETQTTGRATDKIQQRTAGESSKRNNKADLYEFLNEKASPAEVSQEVSTRITLKMEMNCFKQSGIKGKTLEFLDSAVRTVRPSSIEPERTFSTAGRTQTKIRNRMGPKLLDAIVVLRYYLRSKKQ